MPRTALSILILLTLSCGNPVSHRSDEGTLRVVCTPADESTPFVRADLIVSNAAGDPIASAALAFSEKTASGSIQLKAGSGYRVDVYGYDSSNNLTFSCSESDITVKVEKIAAVWLIGRMGEIISKPRKVISGIVTGADSVTLILSGDMSASRTVNSGELYYFIVMMGEDYTVTPTKAGYTFNPASVSYSNLMTNQNLDFTRASYPVAGISFISIPGGTFQMGSDKGDSDEMPIHTVTLSGFEMSMFEITQGQYTSVIGTNPSYFKGDKGNDNHPVENVSWWDAIKFCNALSRKMGFGECYNEISGAYDFSNNGFRLPTEAEWEYACRAGTTTLYNLGNQVSDLDRAGWYLMNSDKTTHSVGLKTPNAWGLYDMHGNVNEWCTDCFGLYSGGNAIDPIGSQNCAYRVYRGGNYADQYDRYCRSASRNRTDPKGTGSIGIRVVRRP